MILVVGAGVAGSLAARALALRGNEVLLVDRARFPRAKVCGACIGPEAIEALRTTGLGDLPGRLGATPLQALSLHASGKGARLPLAGGVALSRTALDHALVEAAREAGVEFRDGVSEVDCDPELTILATGLGGRVRRGSLVGAGAELEADGYEPGVIYMAHSRYGYVGATQAERLICGAALRPSAVRRWGIQGAVARVLDAAGRPMLPEAEWRGTPLLTRTRARPYEGRSLYAGDAAGYVEPFTGEGIGWAMRSGLAVAELAGDGWREDLGERWTARRDALLHPAQRRCRMLTRALRCPGAVSLAVRTLRIFPSMAPRIVRTTTAWA
ncbi:MAG: NAD(P)/FAD-dependent oxidoreductase [Planctomycetota bacterium]